MESSLLSAFVENYSQIIYPANLMAESTCNGEKLKCPNKGCQDISVHIHFDGPPQTSLCLSTVNINMSTTSIQMDFQLTVISFELMFIVFGS